MNLNLYASYVIVTILSVTILQNKLLLKNILISIYQFNKILLSKRYLKLQKVFKRTPAPYKMG